MIGFVTRILPVYLALISTAAVFVTVGDKLSAKRGGRRVSENTLILRAALGGSAAMLLIMLLILCLHLPKRYPLHPGRTSLLVLYRMVLRKPMHLRSSHSIKHWKMEVR